MRVEQHRLCGAPRAAPARLQRCRLGYWSAAQGRPHLQQCSGRLPSACGCRRVRQLAVRRAAQAGAQAQAEEAGATPLQTFLVWLRANGVEGVGDASSKLALFEAEDGGRGMLFVTDAAAEEPLLSIPLRLALTDHPDDAASNAALGPGSPLDVRLALKLLQQAQQGAASPWHPFLQVLPQSVPSAYGSWPASATPLLQMPGGAPGLAQALACGSDGLPGHGVSGEELRWALSVVNSRSFQTPGQGGALGVRMLVPLADMLNHAGDEAGLLLDGPGARGDNVQWELVPPAGPSDGWAFRVKAARDCQAGEEALLCYGQLSGWQCLLTAGFVPARNSHETAVLFPDTAAAIAWFLDRFPPQGEGADAAALVAAAQQAAERQAQPLHESLHADAVAAALHASLQLTSRGEVDARLMAALASLAQPESATPQAAAAKAERLVGLRIAELLHHPQVGSLLLDLQLLGSLATADADERAHWQALQQHYAQVIERFESEFAAVKALSASVSGAAAGGAEPAAAAGEQGLEGAGLLALRLRAAQKQVLWDGLQALLMQQPPAQQAPAS